jgi:hypothetical protein
MNTIFSRTIMIKKSNNWIHENENDTFKPFSNYIYEYLVNKLQAREILNFTIPNYHFPPSP